MRNSRLIPTLLLSILMFACPGSASAVEVGEKAPDFSLRSTQEGQFKLSDALGRKNVVIQFYVLDFTPT